MSSTRGSPSSDPTFAARQALENGLRSKLTAMENAVARVGSIKSHLRKNAEQTRRDLSSSISAQMEALRSREQQLTLQLDEAFGSKDAALSSQQEHLNQHIGACLSTLECLRHAPLDAQLGELQEMLNRFNAVDVDARCSPAIGLTADNIRLRSAILDWGRVRVDDSKNMAGESLPVEMEEIDDAPMAHKSVMWTRTEQPREEYARSVQQWLLAQQNGGSGQGSMEDFDDCRSTTTDSTFEVIDAKSFTDSVKTRDARPMSDWLPSPMGGGSGARTGENSPMAPSFPGLRPPPPLPVVAPQTQPAPGYEFERVISRLMNSSNEAWLAPGPSRDATPDEEEVRAPSSTPTAKQSEVDVATAAAMRLSLSESMADRMRALQRDEEEELMKRRAFNGGATTDQLLAEILRQSGGMDLTQWARIFNREKETTDKWLAAKSS